MKNYFIRYELGDGIPDYEFVIRAKSSNEAITKSASIIATDYPEQWAIRGDSFSCYEITAEELLERLTIN